MKKPETYQQMWIYENHHRVENEGEKPGFVTQDYDIAIIFGTEEGRSFEKGYRHMILI